MTQQILGRRGSRRRRRFAVLAPFALLVGLVLVLGASAGSVATASGFEDDDGNLAVNTTGNTDWNSFSGANRTWTGTAPTRQADGSANGWTFKGIEDWQATNADSAFAGGTKQDDNCSSVIAGKAPNKDDLKRIYLATKSINGHIFLDLAWIRIKQNTTSPSAHIGFEFNKGSTACGAGSDGLVNRTAGDMLIVYDFEGGSTQTPVITMRRWVNSGSCEISSNSAPCWGPAVNLTALGFAEAKVNTDATALDTAAPSTETLGLSEFGEAGIDLTDAGVFTPGQCESFGKAYGVSRSSGNSGTAQMKDLVGPANFTLANCGTIIIHKQTSPRGLNQNFDFSSTNLQAAGITCTSDSTPNSFTLNDNGNSSGNSTSNTETCTNVPIGSYTVTEGADPASFSFAGYSCTVTGQNGSTATPSNSTTQKNVTIEIGGADTVECTYTNNLLTGALKITKTSAKTGNALAGAHFTITKDGTPIAQTPAAGYFTSNSSGVVCADNLALGDYVVTETQAPTGFAIDTTGGRTVTVHATISTCASDPFLGDTTAFTDSALSDIQVNFRDGGSGETNNAGTKIECDPANGNGTDSTTTATGWDMSLTRTGIRTGSTDTVIHCTITIDP